MRIQGEKAIVSRHKRTDTRRKIASPTERKKRSLSSKALLGILDEQRHHKDWWAGLSCFWPQPLSFSAVNFVQPPQPPFLRLVWGLSDCLSTPGLSTASSEYITSVFQDCSAAQSVQCSAVRRRPDEGPAETFARDQLRQSAKRHAAKCYKCREILPPHLSGFFVISLFYGAEKKEKALDKFVISSLLPSKICALSQFLCPSARVTPKFLFFRPGEFDWGDVTWLHQPGQHIHNSWWISSSVLWTTASRTTSPSSDSSDWTATRKSPASALSLSRSDGWERKLHRNGRNQRANAREEKILQRPLAAHSPVARTQSETAKQFLMSGPS